MDQRNESELVGHEPCPACGSKDNLARYDDGHGWCFGCGYYDKGENLQTQEAEPDSFIAVAQNLSTEKNQKPKALLTQDAEYKALQKRRISEETCKKWGYQVSSFSGKTVQIANYYDDNRKKVAQKIRFPNKDFIFMGDTKNIGLYGQWLWRDGGRMVVVCEGELDALTVSTLQKDKWPVVSVPNGAQGAAKAVRNNLKWLNKYDKVIFMFDQDAPGNAATEECIHLLAPGKAAIATLPLKDASEMHQAGRGSEVIDAIWGAKEWRPDGIVNAKDMFEELLAFDDMDAIDYPWEGLNKMTRGLRKREITTFCAGSGIGKSTACREIAHFLLKKDEKIGYIALEESVRTTLKELVGIELNKRLSIDMEDVDESVLRVGFDNIVGSGNCYLHNHFGSLNSDRLIEHIRYLATGMEVQWIILDHLSIVVSGDEGIGDERRSIDVLMTKLRSLVEETGVGLVLVSHLKRPEGKGHEEGAKVTLAQLRGSAAIAQLSDMVLGMERNQQDPTAKDLTTLRVLKNRFTGETGEACDLRYDNDTGRLTEESGFFEDVEEDDDDDDFIVED